MPWVLEQVNTATLGLSVRKGTHQVCHLLKGEFREIAFKCAVNERKSEEVYMINAGRLLKA
jgi:hypothetical protein